MRCFSEGLKNEFETAVVNETSVFEPSKFYCTRVRDLKVIILGVINEYLIFYFFIINNTMCMQREMVKWLEVVGCRSAGSGFELPIGQPLIEEFFL